MTAMRSGFFAAWSALLCAGVVFGQQAAANSTAQAAYVPSMTFDVASVRESPPSNSITMSGGGDSIHTSRVRLTNWNVLSLLHLAYGADRAQVVGLPDWARGFGPFFTVEARSDESADQRLAKLSDERARLEKQHMLQVLLANRFQLKVHWETKEGPIYDLVVQKNGPKLQPGGSLPPSPEELHAFGERKIPALYQRGDGIKGYEYVCHECSIKSLAEELTSEMGTSVIDKTDLTGTYDFVLRYRGRGPDESDDPNAWPPLLTAVPDQLGLKMQSSKGEKQFLVVDHIERPSAN